MSIGHSVPGLPFLGWGDSNAIKLLQHRTGNPLTDQGHRRGVFTELVNGEDAIAYHLCFGGEEGGEDQARTVTQQQVLTQEQRLGQIEHFFVMGRGQGVMVGLHVLPVPQSCAQTQLGNKLCETRPIIKGRSMSGAYLEMFSSAWSGRDWHLLALEESVDGGALPHVGVTHHAHSGESSRAHWANPQKQVNQLFTSEESRSFTAFQISGCDFRGCCGSGIILVCHSFGDFCESGCDFSSSGSCIILV